MTGLAAALAKLDALGRLLAQGVRPSPERTRAILEERARALAAPAATAAGHGAEHLAFRAGGARYALELRHVRRVVSLAAPTRLPGAPPFFLGLVNLRGEPLLVVDPGAFFSGGAAAMPGSERARVVVLGGERDELGLAATALELLGLAPAELGPVPEPARARFPELIRAATPGGLAVLDGGALLAHPLLFLDTAPGAERPSP